MADPENDAPEPTDPPDNNGGGTGPETDDAQATDPPDNNGGGTTAQ